MADVSPVRERGPSMKSRAEDEEPHRGRRSFIRISTGTARPWTIFRSRVGEHER